MDDSAGVNIINDTNINKILFKLPGADTNMFLTVSSMLNSIRLGLENKYTLENIYGDKNSDNIKLNLKDAKLPSNLNTANKIFENSEVAKLVLGEDTHSHLVNFYNFEFSEYMNQVDDWELNRYLYNI